MASPRLNFHEQADPMHDPEFVAASKATANATWGHGEEIGRELGVSGRTVRFWGEPQWSKPGPVHKVLAFLKACRSNNPDLEGVREPVRLLAAAVDLVPIEIARSVSGISHREVARMLTKLLGQSGALGAAVESILEDGRVTHEELMQWRRAFSEIGAVLGDIDTTIEKAFSEGEGVE